MRPGLPITERTKLVVGVDYGTTYTGVAFVHQNATDPKDIKTFTDWPGASNENNEHNEKTPSIIAYASENPEQEGQNAWGYEVESGSHSYSWTKLLLDARTQPAKHDDPALRSGAGNGMMKLPPNKTATDVVADYLEMVYNQLMGAIVEKCGGPDILEVTPIEYWLTVPAIWSDEAKAATRTAAMRAGFGSRLIDEINLIPEPEAAAMLALTSNITEADSLVKPNTGVLVCDCGGGTVDITSYTIARTSPKLLLRESSKGDGAKCGGTYIDRNLHALLKKRFGTAFSNLPADRTGPNSRFMAAFESKKQQFAVGQSKKPYKLPLKMPEFEARYSSVPNYDKIYDRKYGDVLLTQQDMLECFEPIVNAIINLVDTQIQNVRGRMEPEVGVVVLVGGLGCSKHVRNSLNQWCQDRQIRMITPWSGAWSAVARGAALHGLDTVKIQQRITRRWYGHEVARPFDHEVDPIWKWKSTYIDLFTGRNFLGGQTHWIVAKNTTFDDFTEIEASWNQEHGEGQLKEFEADLHSCSLDTAPKFFADGGTEHVGKIVVNYGNVDLNQFESCTDKDGTRVWRLPVKVLIKLGSRQGTLTFRTFIQGRECGESTMDFSGH